MRLAICLLATMMFPAVLFAEKPAPPPPTPAAEVVLREVRYDGQLTDNEARFAVDVNLDVPAKGGATLTLLEGDVAVLASKLPAGLRLDRAGNQYRLLADKAGSYKFKLELVAKITRTEPWNQITFTGPAAAIASVTAQAAGTGLELQLLSGTLQESTVKGGVTRVRGFLGSERVVSLRWQSRVTEVTRQALLTCETAATAQITPTVVKYSTQLRYEILQGTVSRLVVSLPATQALTKLQGEQIRDWQTQTEGDRQLLTVEFIKPVEKACNLTLFSEQAVEGVAGAGTVPVSPPQPQSVERESGSLTLAAEDVVVETASAVGLRQVNPDARIAGALAAYQFYARPFTLALRLRRIEPVVKVADRVAVRLEESRLLVTHALTLTVEKAGVYAVEMGPAAGLVVADVRGDGVEDWKVAGGKLLVNFASRVLGTRRLEVQLEQALKAVPEKIEVLPLRVAGAAQERAQIGAAAVAGIQLKTVATDLAGAREIPIGALSERTDETLAYTTDQPDWKLALGTERLGARVTADIFNLVTIGDGLVGGSATIRYAILNQGVQELRVEVPGHWKNVDFTGPNIRRKEKPGLAEKEGGQIWVIGLQEKAWGGYTLVVTYDFQFDPHRATLGIGGIHARDVERETGSVAIASAASLQIKEAVAAGTVPAAAAMAFHRIDESGLAANDRALITRPVLLAYRYLGPKYDLAMDVARFGELPVLEAVADRTQLTSVLTDQGQMLSQASYMVKNNNRQFQTFTMPPGADFLSCLVSSQPVTPEKDGQNLLVPLPRGANRDQAFAVDIVYAQKVGGLKSRWPRTVSLVAPHTDMQTTYAEWELYVPEKVRLAGFAGNMTVARGTTYGWHDAWLAFCRFYDGVFREMRWLIVVLIVVAGIVALIVTAIRKGWRGLGATILVVVIGLILAGMMLPALNQARGKSRRASSMSNLRQIGLGLSMFADQHDGAMPAGFEDLKGIIGSERIFTDVESGERFVYVGGGRKWQDAGGEDIIAFSPVDTDGRNVLFSDGHVEFINNARFNELMSRPTLALALPPAKAAAAPPASPRPPAAMDKLNSIVIPEINFRDANLTDVIGFLGDESRKRSPNHEGVNFVLQLGETESAVPAPVPVPGQGAGGVVALTPPPPEAESSAGRKITLSLRQIPLGDALKYVTSVAGLKYRVEDGRVLILPKDAPEGGLLTRTYPIAPGAIRRAVDGRALGGLGGERATGDLSRLAVGGGGGGKGPADMKRFFEDAGVPFPSGSDLTYDDRAGRMIVRNTPENLETMEQTLATLSVVPAAEASPLLAGGGAVMPVVAGIRPIRIDIPRTGVRFVFTKVLNVRDEALSVQAQAMDKRAFNVLRGSLQTAVFLVGLALLVWQFRAAKRSSFFLALGLVLAVGSVVNLLLATRLLDVVMILGAPVLGVVIVIWLVRKFWPRKQTPETGPQGLPPVPPAGNAGSVAPPVIAVIALLLFGTAAAEAAETAMVTASIFSATMAQTGLGILGILLVFGVPIVLAWLAQRLVRRLGYRKTAVLVGVCVWVVVQSIPLWPELRCAYLFGKQKRVLEDLRQLGSALEAYAQDHQGALPDTLESLTPKYLPDHRCLVDRESGERFVYLGRGLKWEDADTYDSVIAYSPTDAKLGHGHKARTVLLGSGYPQLMYPDRFEKAMQTSRKAGPSSALLPSLAGLSFIAVRRRKVRCGRGSAGASPSKGGARLALALLAFGVVVAQAEMPAPRRPEVTIQSATYTGTVRAVTAGEAGQTAQFEVVIELEAARDGQSVRLFGPEVAVQEFTAVPATVKLVREGPGVSVLLPKRGKATVRLKFLTKTTGDVAKRQLSFAIPPALVSRAVVTLDEPEAAVEVPTAVSVKRVVEKDQTRIEAVIGAGEQVELVWTPRVKRAAEIAATVFCQNTVLVTVGGGAVNARAVLDYQVTQGELRQMRVRVPAGQRLMRVEGETIRTWKVGDEGGTPILVVELQKGVSPSYRLTVETERILEATGDPAAGAAGQAITVEVPHALDVKRETGLLALKSSEELSLFAEPVQELQKVDVEEFGRTAGLKTPGVATAYRFLRPEFVLRMRVEPVQPQIEAVVRNQVRVGMDQINVSAMVDYTIKRAGVFGLRLALPAGYRVERVTGDKVAQWVEKTEGAAHRLEVTLTERTTGGYSLRLDLVQVWRELPRSVAVAGVHPLGTQKLSGFVAVSAEDGVQIKAESFEGLSEVPAASVARAGMPVALLAYKFIQSEPRPEPGWKVTIATEKLDSWLRAEVVNWVTFSETLVSARALVRYEIQNAPTKEFRLKAPPGAKNFEITGANIRRRDQQGDQWQVELQNKVKGTFLLTATWEWPLDLKSGMLDVKGVEALAVERETGALAIIAPPPLQVQTNTVSADLQAVDASELPDWAGRAPQPPVLVYRYLRPGYALALRARRFEEAEVLQALVDRAQLTTVVSEDGQMMTEMALAVRNNARQYLEVTLPEGAQVWSAFVAGQPVRPSQRDGKLLLPMERSAGEETVAVELVYVGAQRFPRRRGVVTWETPAVDLPLKNARWELYLPPDYQYGRFEGSMQPEVAAAAAAPVAAEFTLGDYAREESRKLVASKSEMHSLLGNVRSNLEGGNLKGASEYYNRARGKFDVAAGEEFKQLEKDFQKAQAQNLFQAQQQVMAMNNAPADQPQAASQPQGVQYDELAAEQQWKKLQQAQEVTAVKLLPLRVNLPKRGLRYAFTQVLQTEVGKTMTVRFAANNARSMSWPLRAGLGLGMFVLVWVLAAGGLGRKQS